MTLQAISDIPETLTDRLNQALSHGDLALFGVLTLLVLVILTAWMDGQGVQPPKSRNSHDPRMAAKRRRN